MRNELNDALLAALRPPAAGRLELRDSRVPELSLRVTASDRRTWAVRARLPDGRQVRPTLGQYPELGLAAARRRAKQVLGEIARGRDPTGEKRRDRAERLASETAPTVAGRLAEWQAAKAGDWSERYRAELARVAAKKILPKFGGRPLAETTREDWVGLATAQRGKTPVAASWLYDVTSSFLNYAEAAGWIAANPLPRRGRNHLVPRAQARDRVLSDDELRAVWRASARLSPKTRVFARLLVLTAARVSEVADIAVGEVDWLKAEWTIPAARAKNGHALTVPLAPAALAELRAVWPASPVGPSYRLLGAIAGSGLQAPSKVKLRLDKLSQTTGWRWHDLRRSVRTNLARLGISDRAGEAALNHISDRSALVRVYDRYNYAAEAKAALAAWQAHVAQLIKNSTASAAAAG